MKVYIWQTEAGWWFQSGTIGVMGCFKNGAFSSYNIAHSQAVRYMGFAPGPETWELVNGPPPEKPSEKPSDIEAVSPVAVIVETAPQRFGAVTDGVSEPSSPVVRALSLGLVEYELVREGLIRLHDSLTNNLARLSTYLDGPRSDARVRAVADFNGESFRLTRAQSELIRQDTFLRLTALQRLISDMKPWSS